jgi:hypothetical protein
VFILLFFLLFTCHLSLVAVHAASPGLNLINDPSSNQYTINQEVQNWVLYAPGSPQELLTADIQANNVIVRIHSSWTDTGQHMLGNNQQQSSVASEWSQVINQLATSGKTVYVEPFNELEQDYERRSPDGYLTLNESISRANNFISLIKGQLQNAILISPALDPQNPNYAVTSKAFSYFDIISYHPYRSDTAINYNTGPLAGKKFLFTEIGVDKNGLIYNDQAFIDFFCGEGVISQWQSRPDIIAYFLFTATPGNFSGDSWSINDNVANAISGKCDQTNLPNPNHRPSIAPEPPPDNSPVSLTDLIEPAVNGAPYFHPLGYKRGIYDNHSYPNMKGGNICTFQASIKQDYSPKETTIKNEDGSTTTETEPIIATSVKGRVKADGPQTNLGEAKFCTYTAYNSDAPTHHQRYVFPTTGAIRMRQDFTSYGRLGYNPITRSMTFDEEQVLRYGIFIDAARSLETDPLKRDPYLMTNDQIIGYACHASGGCRDTNRQEEGCRPMFMSEYIYEMAKSGDINKFDYAWGKDDKGNRKLVHIGVPGDVQALLSKFYEGGGYAKLTGIDYWTTFVPCYKRGYTYFLATNPGCASINTEVTVKNIGPGGIIQPTPYPHTMPNLAAASSPQAYQALGWYHPFKTQANLPKADICSMGGGYNTPNRPSPLDFLAWFENFVQEVKEKITITKTVEVDVDYPSNISKNAGSINQMFFNLTPHKDQGKLARTGSDSTAGGGAQLPIAHPGATIDKNLKPFSDQLLPASWQL